MLKQFNTMILERSFLIYFNSDISILSILKHFLNHFQVKRQSKFHTRHRKVHVSYTILIMIGNFFIILLQMTLDWRITVFLYKSLWLHTTVLFIIFCNTVTIINIASVVHLGFSWYIISTLTDGCPRKKRKTKTPE